MAAMIASQLDGPVARITLDRAVTRNALTDEGWLALADAVAGVAASRARVLLLGSAAPGPFCAGSDLGQLAQYATQPDGPARLRAMMRAALDGLRTLPIPSIAVVDGGCFGAGVAVAMACDLRIAGAGARFAVTPAKLGISYPQEDVARLVELVGPSQAGLLLYSAGMIDGAEAARIGLVDRAVEDAAAAAETLAQAIADNAPSSVRLFKRMLGAGGAGGFDDSFDEAFSQADFIEGVAAFREKREPRFD
jgi:enoyl-CoA hydratase/carnithine racemase